MSTGRPARLAPPRRSAQRHPGFLVALRSRAGSDRAGLAVPARAAPLARGALGAIAVPVLFQGGTADPLITEVLEARVFPATAAASPACLVVYRDAGHLARTELDATHHAATAAATAAFLGEVLAGRRPTAAALASPAAARAACR